MGAILNRLRALWTDPPFPDDDCDDITISTHDLWDDADLTDPVTVADLAPIGVYAHHLRVNWERLVLKDGRVVSARVMEFSGPNLNGGGDGDDMTVRVALNGAVLRVVGAGIMDDYVDWAVQYANGMEA